MSKISLDRNGEKPTLSEVAVGSDVTGGQTGSGDGSRDTQSASHKPTVADVLKRHGLWLTRREMRETMGAELESDGYTVEQVDKVCSYVLSMASDVRMGCGELVNLLRDRNRLKQTIEDLAAMRGRVHPGEADRQRTAEALRQERQEWAEADRLHYVRCRRADGISEEQAQAEWAAAHGGKR